MDALKTSQHSPPTRRARRATARNDQGPWANRQLRATDAVVQRGRLDRQLIHPIGGLEGYSPAEVGAEQMRDPERPKAVTGYLSIES
jgi:hypothetical protein